MSRIIETIVYSADELEGAPRDHACDWYRRTALSDDWHDFLFEDFGLICAIIGVDLRLRPVRLQGGGTRAEPAIFFSGFSSQGDGASFEGHYRYAPKAARRIRDHAPQDTAIHEIADRLQTVQRPWFYGLEASIRQTGRYVHEYSMAIIVSRASLDVTPGAEDIVIEALRDLARWFYRQLEAAYDYVTSDEQVDEGLRAAGFTFTEDGQRFG